MEEEKKKKSGVPIWVWIFVGVLGLGIVSVAFGGEDNVATSDADPSGEVADTGTADSSEDSTPDQSSEPQEAESEVSAGLGDPVSQDAFVFTVNSMECGISQVGSDLLGEEAQGQYCKISVSVENAGNEAEYFSADSQVVYDDQGREFEADTAAMIYLDEGSEVWLGDDINPGNTIEAVLLYDMPEGVEPVTIALKEGFFGSAVEVALR